jgi:serine O-acetyltransferase
MLHAMTRHLMKNAPHFRQPHRPHSHRNVPGATPESQGRLGADEQRAADTFVVRASDGALKTDTPTASVRAQANEARPVASPVENTRTMAFFEDLRVAQEGLGSLGFWALQVYRLGHLRYRFQSRLVRYPLGALHLVLAKLAEMFCGVTIGVSAKIGRRLIIEHSGAIVVHGNAVIGDDCIIRQGVTIGNQRMDRPFDAPRIGNRVNIGAGAKILGAVSVGDDADIGANAVVITDVPAGALAVGVPARIILRGPVHETP